MSAIKKFILLFSLCVIASVSAMDCPSIIASSQTIAEALGWKADKKSSGSLCHGHYTQPLFISDNPQPPSYQTTPVTMTAQGPATFKSDGVSILRGHVEIQQPGRLIRADKATIFHDKQTGKVTRITLDGHVRIQENGRLLVGNNADYHITSNTLTMNHVIYHIAGKHELHSAATSFDAWGNAQSMVKKANGVIELKNVRYSTCAPDDPSWDISANSMSLDRDKGNGTAHNVVIHFKKVPIFYTPYYSFPLNAARKSGLLPPAFGYLNGEGFYYNQPYYWNIAPNDDLIFSPSWYSDRGTQLNAHFRYLTANSDGSLYISFMPDDREFAQFRQTTLDSFANTTPPAGLMPYIRELTKNSRHRGLIDFVNHVTFNDLWSGKFYARYVTDPYFAQDFQSEFLTQNTNQMPSFAELNYEGNHWHDTFLVQSYQTLHPINQFTAPAQNQYTRLPEMDFHAAYPSFIPGYDFNFSGQAVHFKYDSAFSPLTYQVPIGNRIHLQPSISKPFTGSSFYFTPTVTADNTSYFADLPSANITSPRPGFEQARTLPIADIDSGLYFDRSLHIGHRDYIQTIEPRLFYLYTPYLNQNNYPNFDTQLLPFSVTNLYSLNEFTGFDRLQNANQLTIGLSSRLLRADNANNVLNGQIGLIDYFTNPHVCLSQNCSDLRLPQSISPITGELTWNPNALWSISTQAAWDSILGQINNAQTGAQYRFDDQHIILLNYQFMHGSFDTPFNSLGFSANTSLLSVGLVWPVTLHWRFIGYTYYDLTHDHPENQYIGLSYDTCCWALRMIMADNFKNTLPVDGGTKFVNQYTTAYYVEFLLKGLGSVGNRRAEDMLMSTLPGFEDVFSNHGHYGYSHSV